MPDISTPNLDYNNMIEAWDINDALMGGTLYMRQLGEQYMPRWPNEDDESYKTRLSQATLLPVYEETIKQNVGRVFSEPTKLSETMPSEIVNLCKNIDLEGNRLDVWAQEWFSLAQQYGVAYALVEYPRVDNESVKTVADEKALGVRPYVVMLNPRQVIGWKSKTEGGKGIVTELRIKETVTEDGDDFGQKKIEQIRHISEGHVAIWRKSKGEDGSVAWEIHEEWDVSRKGIAFIQLYTKRIGFMRGVPPLLNLALLNIKHWQSQSEQDNILHVARVPILMVFGLGENQELTIGSSCATEFTDRSKQGIEYAEHSGAAIGSGKESLATLEMQMRMAGAKMLRTENTSTKALDQVNEEKMQEQSPLYTMANSLEDALDNILQIMAEYLGLPEGGSVDVRTDIETAEQGLNSQAAIAIQSLRQGGDIRPIDAVRALQSLKIIDPDAKPELILDELNNPAPNFVGGNNNGNAE